MEFVIESDQTLHLGVDLRTAPIRSLNEAYNKTKLLDSIAQFLLSL